MRQNLMLRGLTAEIAITKQQRERKVAVKNSKLFKSCFHPRSQTDDELFQFHYLSGFPGTRLLKIPEVNNAFSWDGALVLSLNKQQSILLSATNSNCAVNLALSLM